VEEIGIVQKSKQWKLIAVVNTGHQGGPIHLRCHLDQPLKGLKRFHLNELPMRHSCKELIGSTKGPTEYKETVAKALCTC
jgi:hypothetical protein